MFTTPCPWIDEFWWLRDINGDNYNSRASPATDNMYGDIIAKAKQKATLSSAIIPILLKNLPFKNRNLNLMEGKTIRFSFNLRMKRIFVLVLTYFFLDFLNRHRPPTSDLIPSPMHIAHDYKLCIRQEFSRLIRVFSE